MRRGSLLGSSGTPLRTSACTPVCLGQVGVIGNARNSSYAPLLCRRKWMELKGFVASNRLLLAIMARGPQRSPQGTCGSNSAPRVPKGDLAERLGASEIAYGPSLVPKWRIHRNARNMPATNSFRNIARNIRARK